jgi:hypothetical protein
MLIYSVLCRPLIANGFNYYIIINMSAHVTLSQESYDLLILTEVYDVQIIKKDAQCNICSCVVSN